MELGKRHLAVGVAAVFIIALFTVSGVASIWSEGNMNFGDANCSVMLGVVGLDANGNKVTAPIFNSPLYLDGVEVSSVQFVIRIIASGTNVIWSTLNVHFTISSEGSQASGLITWTIADFANQSDGSYIASGEYTVDEYIDLLQNYPPDQTLPDGTDVYILNVAAVVFGSITDLKGNELTSDVTVQTDFQLTSAPSGTFSLREG